MAFLWFIGMRRLSMRLRRRLPWLASIARVCGQKGHSPHGSAIFAKVALVNEPSVRSASEKLRRTRREAPNQQMMLAFVTHASFLHVQRAGKQTPANTKIFSFGASNLGLWCVQEAAQRRCLTSQISAKVSSSGCIEGQALYSINHFILYLRSAYQWMH